ncbi:MAG: hypothetical protein COB15_05180 [Flavobacteriales bacterium]|nr:MAG: hypothetical protein COB15_05180 [Flavobacteriales bacterium]
MKQLFIVTILSVLLISCGEQNNSDNSSISGNLTNLNEGSQVYLDYLTPTQLFTKDTAIIDGSGNYHFNYKIEDLGYYRLRINNENFINLVFNVGETPIINGDGSNLMDSYTIEGSPESNKLKQFQIAYKVNNWKQDSLGALYNSNRNDQELFVKLQVSKFGAISEMKKVYMGLIEENPASLVSLAAVQQLDAKVAIDLYRKVDHALNKTIPNNPWFLDFHKKLESMVSLYVGEPAPEFTLNNTDGNPISLSSLKGKVVLIDFWASWCRPCRAENPNVVKLYNKYKNKGFDVLSVSLDGMPRQQNAKQDWLAAIEKDGLVWKNHVSDLKGWKSSVVPQFNIEGIPFTLLVDEKGIIIGMNLRGMDLEKKLATVFK